MNSSNNNTTNATTMNQGDEKQMRIMYGSLAVLAVLTNAPLLVVLLKRKSQTAPVFCARMSYLVGNLALADCLSGLFTFLYAINPNQHYYIPAIWCAVQASFFTLLLVSAERFIVLSYPLTWPFFLTTRRTFLAIAFTWLLSVACGISVHFYSLRAQFVLAVIFEVLVFAVISLHTIIILHLHKRHHKFCERFSEISESRKHNINASDQKNATKVILILVIILVVTVVPYIITMQLILGYILDYWHLSTETYTLADDFLEYLHIVEQINFVANPFVYAWRIKRYREAFQDAFHSILNVRPTTKELLN